MRLLSVRWRHCRPEEVGESRRHKMLNRPSYNGRTGLRNGEFFLASPATPGKWGRSDGAASFRAGMATCKSWQQVVELVKTAKMEGKLEASVFGAAMQTCGNEGWWKGMLELHRLRKEEAVLLPPIVRNIALTALAHCLKGKRDQKVVLDRVPIALEMAKEYWREAGVGDARDFNIGVSSALKLATCLDCEAAHQWGMEVWSDSRPGLVKDQISFNAHLAFLEHYRRSDEVDRWLQHGGRFVLNVVLLGSLLDCSASQRDWKRAEALWETFIQRQVRPNLMAYNARAKVHLFAGRPLKVLEVYDHAITDFLEAMKENYKVGGSYAQALLLLCHSSLNAADMSRLEEFLKLALEKGPSSPKGVREDLLKMRQVLKKLLSRPREVYLRDVLVQWRARELSVMAEWENFPAGSRYLDNSEAE